MDFTVVFMLDKGEKTFLITVKFKNIEMYPTFA